MENKNLRHCIILFLMALNADSFIDDCLTAANGILLR